jgi:hypothetical protein
VDEIARYFGFVPSRGRLLRWLMGPAAWALTYVRR